MDRVRFVQLMEEKRQLEIQLSQVQSVDYVLQTPFQKYTVSFLINEIERLEEEIEKLYE